MQTLYRTALGYAIRDARLMQGKTLRDVAYRAHMALGYLSEIERGQKDASSEMLLSISRGLGTTAGKLMLEAAETLLNWEEQESKEHELDELRRELLAAK